MGEVYFRIAKDFGIMPTEVIRKKFTPDMRFLILKYSEQIRQEQKANKEMEDKLNEMRN